MYRVAKTYRMHYLYRSISRKKSPVISGSLAKNDLQVKACYESWLPCTMSHINQSRHVWIESCHIWRSHISHVNESCHTFYTQVQVVWGQLHLCVKYVTASRSKGMSWRRPIGCLIFMCHFPQKSLVISSSLAKNDLQLKASLVIGYRIYIYIYMIVPVPVPVHYSHPYK